MKNVLFLDSVHPILEQRLQSAGWTTIHDYTHPLNELELEQIQGIVIRSRITIDEAFLNKAPLLEFIARSGSGLENIDLNACKEKGIIVFNSPEGNSTAVGEHATGMLLMLLNKLRMADAEVRNGFWNRESNRGLEIENKTVGLIGYGVMGKAFAQRLSGFNCRVLAFDKYKENYSNKWAQQATLDEIFKESDIVSLHVPLNAETKYLADAAFFKSFEKEIIFINTSRGLVVSLKDLLDAMKSKKVIGAALDVLEYEETSFEKINLDHPEFHELKKREDVIFSPHVAGWTVESYYKLSSVLADKILAHFRT